MAHRSFALSLNCRRFPLERALHALLLSLLVLELEGCATLRVPRSGLYPATRAELNGITGEDPFSLCPSLSGLSGIDCLVDLPFTFVADTIMLPVDGIDLMTEHQTPEVKD